MLYHRGRKHLNSRWPRCIRKWVFLAGTHLKMRQSVWQALILTKSGKSLAKNLATSSRFKTGWTRVSSHTTPRQMCSPAAIWKLAWESICFGLIHCLNFSTRARLKKWSSCLRFTITFLRPKRRMTPTLTILTSSSASSNLILKT